MSNKVGFVLINALTGSRLAFATAVAALTPWSRNERWAIIASIVLIVAIEMTDLFDGMLARQHGVVSTFGKLFDPYADSISRIIVYWSLAVVGRCFPVVPLVMAVRDISVTYIRILLTRQGRDVSARYTGKVKAWVQGVCAPFLMAGPGVAWLHWTDWGTAMIWTGSIAVMAITLASLADYALAYLRKS